MVGNKSVRISRIDIETELISDPQTNSDRLLYIYVQTPEHSRGKELTEPEIGLL